MKQRMQKFLILGLVMVMGSTVSPAAAEIPEISSESIRSLVIVQDGTEIFRISNEPAEYKMNFDYWEVLNPYQETNTVNTETMYQLYDKITGLNFVPLGEEIDRSIVGLEASDTCLQMEYAAEDEGSVESTKIFLGNQTEDGKYYAEVEGVDEIYLLSASVIDSVFGLNPMDYILKIPVLVNIEYLESVDITAGKDAYTMEKDGGKYCLNGKKVEKEKFTTLYQALMNVFLDSEIEVNQERDREEVLRVKYHMKEEAKDFDVAYFTWEDEKFYTVEVNGVEQFLVDAVEVEALIEQIHDIY